MIVISKSSLKIFYGRYPQAKKPLLEWYRLAKDADWNSFAALKKTFPATDYVGHDLYVFNIAGNRYKLIARIFFSVRTIYVRFLGLHAAYDKVILSKL